MRWLLVSSLLPRLLPATSCNACVEPFIRAHGCEAVRAGNTTLAEESLSGECEDCLWHVTWYCDDDGDARTRGSLEGLYGADRCENCVKRFGDEHGCRFVKKEDKAAVMEALPSGCKGCAYSAVQYCIYTGEIEARERLRERAPLLWQRYAVADWNEGHCLEGRQIDDEQACERASEAYAETCNAYETQFTSDLCQDCPNGCYARAEHEIVRFNFNHPSAIGGTASTIAPVCELSTKEVTDWILALHSRGHDVYENEKGRLVSCLPVDQELHVYIYTEEDEERQGLVSHAQLPTLVLATAGAAVCLMILCFVLGACFRNDKLMGRAPRPPELAPGSFQAPTPPRFAVEQPPPLPQQCVAFAPPGSAEGDTVQLLAPQGGGSILVSSVAQPLFVRGPVQHLGFSSAPAMVAPMPPPQQLQSTAPVVMGNPVPPQHEAGPGDTAAKVPRGQPMASHLYSANAADGALQDFSLQSGSLRSSGLAPPLWQPDAPLRLAAGDILGAEPELPQTSVPRSNGGRASRTPGLGSLLS